MLTKTRTFIVLKTKVLQRFLMDKNTSTLSSPQEKLLFSLPEPLSNKKIKVDFSSPDISCNGGLSLLGSMKGSFGEKIASCIPDYRNEFFIWHTYREMVCQRIGQILCGYEDANDCNLLRGDSSLKMSVGRLPSDNDLSSQPTMTRLENNVSKRTLYNIGLLFLQEFVRSYDKAPKHVILDVDDTNANTHGSQQLTLFNDYYGEYCYMPMLLFDGLTGKLVLPLLRPGRRNKSLNVFGILRRVVAYLHECWPGTIIELRGDSHFCSHEFMDWAHGLPYVRYITGLAGNKTLLAKVARQCKRAQKEFQKDGKPIRRFYKFDYKAKSWKHEQRVIAKVEVNSQGTNIRFVVTRNKNNKPETIYRHYCGRGQMELWIKDLKYFKLDRMSCHTFSANYFRLFLYAAAFVMANKMKRTLFKDTEVERFTMDSFIKRIMLSAVYITEKKTCVRISFSPNHRHRAELEQALTKAAA